MKHEIVKQHEEIIEITKGLGLSTDVADFKPYILTMAKYLPNNTEALLRFSIGLQILSGAMISEKQLEALGFVYQVLASLSAIQAIENGLIIDEDNFRMYNVEQQIGTVRLGPNQALTTNEAAEVSAYIRKKGFTVGLVHGHFRLLTPSSIAFLINAFEHANVLLVGMETGERTLRHKKKEPILSDLVRATVFRTLVQLPFWIDDSIEYSNEGYQTLLEEIQPHVYIGQSDNPIEQKNAMQTRAARVGASYLELQNVPGLSTTEFKMNLDTITTGELTT